MLTELTAGQTPKGVRAIADRAEHLESNLGKLLPPPYPFGINQAKAKQGKALFEQQCARCHGAYERDAKGLPVFRPPRWIALDRVKTDPDRLDVRTPELDRLIASNPLSDILKLTDRGRGYYAPRLEGIWARFPYLHNASVPNIEALLTSPEQRPAVFSLVDAGEEHRFSETLLGLTLPATAQQAQRLQTQASAGARDVYDVSRPGHSNRGHDFGTSLSDEDKSALIEFLKTL